MEGPHGSGELTPETTIRDLWRFALPFSREIASYLFSFNYDFIVWDTLIEHAEDPQLFEGMAKARLPGPAGLRR